METKIEVMIALGVAVGVNCIPCFDHLYGRSKDVGLNEDDIKRIFQIAEKVKGGAAVFMKNAVCDVAGDFTEKMEACGCPADEGCI